MESQTRNDHVPVLLEAVLAYLRPTAGESYLDLTAGYGGHARAILERTQAYDSATLVDRDEQAIATLGQLADRGVELIGTDFLTASTQLVENGRRYDIILADLGLSSPHLDNASRGFAFGADGPLDMRMDRRQKLTARDVVNGFAVDDLIRIIKTYGEEPRARTIAHAIVAARPIETTSQLADIVRANMPKGMKTHPATRTFQAIRIAVNDELELLRSSLPLWQRLLKPRGRLGVISFHSLEDRIVKQYLSEQAGNRYDANLELATKRPVIAEPNEIVFNPRARSARLRVAVKK